MPVEFIQTPITVDPAQWIAAGPVAVAFLIVLIVLLGVGWFAREWLKTDKETRLRQETRADQSTKFTEELVTTTLSSITEAMAAIRQLVEDASEVNAATVEALQQIQEKLDVHDAQVRLYRQAEELEHQTQGQTLANVCEIMQGLEGRIGSQKGSRDHVATR